MTIHCGQCHAEIPGDPMIYANPGRIPMCSARCLMSPDPPLILPIVHLNGTSADELVRQLIAVGVAIRHAMDRLSESAPNQRDYYPQNDRWPLAIKQYERRRTVLATLYGELCKEQEAIRDLEG